MNVLYHKWGPIRSKTLHHVHLNGLRILFDIFLILIRPATFHSFMSQFKIFVFISVSFSLPKRPI